jgi:uncharacterized protein DUF6894
MPRYLLEVKDGDRSIDQLGLHCKDDHDAIDAARTFATQIAAESPNASSRRLTIINELGQEVGSIEVER